MDLGDWVTLLNTFWTLYRMYEEWHTKWKRPPSDDKRRKRKSKGKRRK